MFMKLVDTSVWIEFLRRNGDPSAKRVLAQLLQVEAAAYTCPVQFELLSGAKPNEEDDLRDVLALSRHFQFEQADWRAAALLERQMRVKGLIIPRNDLFVATIAIRAGLVLVCRDNHFNLVQKVVGDLLTVEQV